MNGLLDLGRVVHAPDPAHGKPQTVSDEKISSGELELIPLVGLMCRSFPDFPKHPDNRYPFKAAVFYRAGVFAPHWISFGTLNLPTVLGSRWDCPARQVSRSATLMSRNMSP